MQGFSLSPPQKHLWRLQEHGSLPYQTRCTVRIEGVLDKRALIESLRRAIDRHEILRTGFRCLPGMNIPLQVVAEQGEVSLQEQDLSLLAGEAQDAAVAQWIEEFERRAFDPESANLLTALLITLAPDESLLLLALPALCSDRVGMERLVAEIADGYEGRDGEPGEPLQYPDLAEWQNEMLNSEDTRAGGDLWRRQDWSALASVRLPAERQARTDFQPQRLVLPLDPALIQRIEAAAARRGASVETFLWTCWQILLMRWTGSSELVVGTAYDGRSFNELRNALGLFARYLPVRCHCEDGETLDDLLTRAEEARQQLSQWQQYFSWDLLPDEGPAFAPFCFDFAGPVADPRAGSVSFSIVQRSSCVDRFAVKLVCECRQDGWLTEIHYDTGRLSELDAGRLGESLQALLDSAVSRPDSPVDSLAILGPEEWRRLYGQPEPAAGETGGLVHRELERHAACHGDQWAVVCGEERLTYAELNSRANRLARHLRGLGVEMDSRVAICLERSVDMVVALLAVLKSGGGYVPLDPTLPKGRLLQLLDDSGAQALLTRPGVSEASGEFAGRVVRMDDEAIALRNDQNLPDVEGSLAYVIYTSGSTGTPKGVAVEHASLLHYLRGILQRLGDVEGTHWATVSTFAADLGNTSIFTALCGGGCLHVIPQDRVADPGRLREYLAQNPIDGLKIVPGHLSALLGTAEPRNLLPRRWLVLGGEACGWDLVERVRRAAPECRVLNHYGPTETTVGVLTWEAGAAAPGSATVPLGRPLPGSRVYVLDAGLQGSPSWVAGEVYIGGGGVARGYLNHPQLTAQRFVPDPFGQEPGGRLYRTGDLARCLADGELEFLGRTDDQIKIRGFRVEPGEIEALLRQGPGIEAAAVVVREDTAGDRRLVAYVVPSAHAVDSALLRAWLAERLPSYMIPAAFVRLSALPRTANGKLNRSALPEPRESENPAFVAPRTPVEEMVASLWSDLLGRERVGAEDNFFESGGHSLLATQLLARLQETFGVEVSLRSLFDHPTVAGLARTVEEAMRAGGPLQMPPLQKAPRDGDLPLSFAQQRLWFLDQMEPGNPFYNLSGRLRLTGRLDVPAWKATLSEIVRRHEVLRTTFPTVDGRPLQVIASPECIAVPVVELAGLPSGSREREALRLATEEARRPFDLARGPLFRARVVRLEREDHVALLSMHHIVADGWSVGVLMREVAALYEAFTRGERSPLAELPVQYADFSVWQRQWLRDEVLEEQLAYWRQRLSHLPADLGLPFDRPRPKVQRFRGATEDRMLPRELTQSLEAVGRREGATLFMTLLAAFETHLHRLSGQSDLVVGSPIANRRQAEVEGLVGFFANMLVLRSRVEGEARFDELLRQIREGCLDAYVHQDLPFEKLVEELQPDRNLSRTPLFQVVFVLQNTPRQSRALPGLTLGRMDVENEIAKFDLTLRAQQRPEGLLTSLEYDAALFDATTVRRMLGHFELLLGEIAARPESALSRIPLLTEGETHQLLREWADAPPERSRFSVLHEGFELQARRAGEAVAVVCEGERMTYAELNQRANRLAHYLRGRGVGLETPVALLLDRSPDMMVCILGVLKAGGCYVPLDPAYPAERLALTLEDSGSALLLTCERLLEAAPERRPPLVCLDRERLEIERQSGENPAPLAEGAHVAYVIYTSGSTGRAKGVAVEHRQAVRLFTATGRWFGFDDQDVWTLFHSYAFDFSVWEIWGALLYGGRLVVVPQWVSRSPEAFSELLCREGVTVLNQTPSAFRQLSAVDEDSGALANSALRWVIFGGEALDLTLLKPWFDRHGDERPSLVNMYGITETTVHVTFRPVTRQDLERGWMSVVGRAIPDLRVHLLSDGLEPVPIGVPGEIFVGGAGVARGYLNRPEESASRFIPDPFSQEPGARLYRSGDLARLLPDGELEYLGRVDFQVKVRGFRIDPGEIQAVLSGRPDIREAVVVAREDTPGDRRLVAYFVPREGAEISVGDLRGFLKERLPDYMVPAVFLPLSALPLTPSGKLDRRALPAPAPERPELGEKLVLPSTSSEELLVGIWQEVLGIERIGIQDNFFELGGDSILAIQIIARANQAGLRLTPKQLFQHQTISELAAVAVPSTGPAVVDRKVEEGPVPLTPIQRWFFQQPLPAPHHWNQAVLLEVRPEIPPAALWLAWREVIRQHDALRLRFSQEGSAWRQVQTAPGSMDTSGLLAEVDLAALPARSRSAAIETAAAAAQRSLDLSSGPLHRVVLFHMGPQEPARLLILIHHLVIDGVSWRILLGDLHLACEQLCRAERIALPGKSSSYAEWAQRLAEHARSGAGSEEVDYWLSAARRAAPLLVHEVQVDDNLEAGAGVVKAALSQAETEALLHELPVAYNVRIEDVLLTALIQAYAGTTGKRSLLLDLESHGREDIFPEMDLSRTVGWFTSIFPVLLELPTLEPGEALKSVKEQLRGIPNKGFHHGLLQAPEADREVAERLRALPRPQVSFNYLGQLDQALPGASLFSPAREAVGAARNPLGPRQYIWQVGASVVGKRLQVSWTYATQIHEASTMGRLAESFVQKVRDLIAYGLSSHEQGYTPSDFPLAQVGQQQLDRALGQVQFEGD